MPAQKVGGGFTIEPVAADGRAQTGRSSPLTLDSVRDRAGRRSSEPIRQDKIGRRHDDQAEGDHDHDGIAEALRPPGNVGRVAVGRNKVEDGEIGRSGGRRAMTIVVGGPGFLFVWPD